MTGMMPHLHLTMPTSAAPATTMTNQSTRCGAGKTVCNANQTVRCDITPTTAAVTAERAAVNRWFPRNRSTCGAPKSTHKKPGTKVVQVVISAPRVAARSGDKPPGFPMEHKSPGQNSWGIPPSHK